VEGLYTSLFATNGIYKFKKGNYSGVVWRVFLWGASLPTMYVGGKKNKGAPTWGVHALPRRVRSNLDVFISVSYIFIMRNAALSDTEFAPRQISSQQPTANSQQPTANSQQPTANKTRASA